MRHCPLNMIRLLLSSTAGISSMLLLSPRSVRNCLTRIMSWKVFLFVLAFSSVSISLSTSLSFTGTNLPSVLSFRSSSKKLRSKLGTWFEDCALTTRRPNDFVFEANDLWKIAKRTRCCHALFLLAETEVPTTTVIPSHAKDKNRIFSGYEISSLEKSWCFICVYIIKNIYALIKLR